jgi:hypothetical protein
MNARKRVIDTIKMSLLGSALFACQFVSGQELPKDRTELSNLSVRNQDTFLRDFGPVLKASGGIGRLYLYSECVGDSKDVLLFPRIAVKAQGKGKTGVAAIRDALSNKGVIVAERRPGLIGIRIGDVSNDLLRTRIHVIKLKPMERYNYQDAIAAIIGTTEVQAKMRELHMERSPRVIDYPISSPDAKLPHLSASMTDLTMDEALDQVAQVFRGLLIYEVCEGQNSRRLFSVHMHEM